MVSRAIRNDIKLAKVFSQSRFIISVDLNRADASAAELCGQRLRAREIGVGNDNLFKIAGAREIAGRFRAHRATAAEDDYFHTHQLVQRPISFKWRTCRPE